MNSGKTLLWGGLFYGVFVAVGFAIDHASAHIRIDTHTDIADLDLAVSRVRHLHTCDGKILVSRHPYRTLTQLYLSAFHESPWGVCERQTA